MLAPILTTLTTAIAGIALAAGTLSAATETVKATVTLTDFSARAEAIHTALNLIVEGTDATEAAMAAGLTLVTISTPQGTRKGLAFDLPSDACRAAAQVAGGASVELQGEALTTGETMVLEGGAVCLLRDGNGQYVQTLPNVQAEIAQANSQADAS